MFKEDIQKYLESRSTILSNWKEIPKGFMTYNDIQVLLDCALVSGKIMEFGTAYGASAALMSLITNGFIISVDVFEDLHLIKDNLAREHYQKEFEKEKNTLENVTESLKNFKNVYLQKGRSTEIAENYPDGFFDMIFIDGDHSEEGFSADFKMAYRKIQNRGIILMHDCSDGAWPQIYRYYQKEIVKKYNFYDLNPDRDLKLTSMKAIRIIK